VRIALVYDGAYPYSVGGGEKVFHDLARYLGENHEVHLLTLKLWEGPDTLSSAPGVHLHGICVPLVPYTLQKGDTRSLKQALAFARATFGALKRLGPFDVIDCMATPYFPLYAAWIYAKRSRTPLVSTWLELWARAHWREYLGSSVASFGACGIESLATRLPSHIISISPHTTVGLRSSGVAPARLSTISPWIHIQTIDAIEPDTSPCDVLFVGRLIESKGVGLLLEAMAQLVQRMPRVRCRIIGDGPERARLESLIEERALRETVFLEGFLDRHEDVIAAMKSCRVFVLPSRREGFGIVVIEAAASGALPVTIDSPNNAARDLVREAKCGAVCEDSPSALADALFEQLELTEEVRACDVERARAWALSYDVHQIASAYETIYRRAAEAL
jgi:glycosyltransferase involved in cell wall biosynthesis